MRPSRFFVSSGSSRSRPAGKSTWRHWSGDELRLAPAGEPRHGRQGCQLGTEVRPHSGKGVILEEPGTHVPFLELSDHKGHGQAVLMLR
jgi:hypothetical protein